MQSPVRDLSSIGRTPSTDLSPAAMPGLLARVISVTLLFSPASAFAQAGADWCQEVQRDQHCEVRELILDTRGGRLAVDARPNGGIRVEGWGESDVRGSQGHRSGPYGRSRYGARQRGGYPSRARSAFERRPSHGERRILVSELQNLGPGEHEP